MSSAAFGVEYGSVQCCGSACSLRMEIGDPVSAVEVKGTSFMISWM